MKNIIIFVADSLRQDTYNQTLKPLLKASKIPYIEHHSFRSCNSCTELSLPWMLSGMEIFSENMAFPKDLEKKGYKTFLIHSNPIVGRFSGCFMDSVDLSQRTKNPLYKVTKKYNRLRKAFETHFPYLYKQAKKYIRGTEKNYLPYTRIYDTLPHIPLEPNRLTWVHLMDPHTPYYPLKTVIHIDTIITQNDNQISAVRGYYTPTIDERMLWKQLYQDECLEMSKTLVQFLQTLDFNETTVILTSDHGEEFGEHGHYGHKGNRANPENVDVPFLVFGDNTPLIDFNTHSGLRRYVNSLVNRSPII